MTDNEKLIEEAAKAIYFRADEIGINREVGQLQSEALARAALAVFEKAHTPTDDDREALPINHCPEHGDLLNRPGDGADARSYRCRNAHDIDGIRAGFRRSEVLEPCGAVPREWLDHSEHYPCSRSKGHRGDHATHEMTWAEPQGETSDAQVDDAWWKAQEAGQLPRTPGPSNRQAFEVGYRAAANTRQEGTG